jgi:hypothetical protein
MVSNKTLAVVGIIGAIAGVGTGVYFLMRKPEKPPWFPPEAEAPPPGQVLPETGTPGGGAGPIVGGGTTEADAMGFPAPGAIPDQFKW